MFHRWAALVLVLALCALSPKNAAGQSRSQAPRGHSAGKLGNNYPNPFNPETFIPFSVGDSTCADGGQQHAVTLRILNILAQQVAIPVLQGPSTTSTTSAGSALAGQPLSNLQLGCGDYVAYWNGNVQGTNREAASGTYLVQIFIDGKRIDAKKIYNGK